MGRFARSSPFIALFIIGAPLANSAAVADGYRLDFGAETDRGRDAGTIECRLDQACDGKLESLGLTVRVEVARGKSLYARVKLDGDNPDWCYFAGPTSSIFVAADKPLIKVPLFKGMGARGGLFIQNQRVGALYLRFEFR